MGDEREVFCEIVTLNIFLKINLCCKFTKFLKILTVPTLKGSCTNHVDSHGRGGVSEMSTLLIKPI